MTSIVLYIKATSNKVTFGQRIVIMRQNTSCILEMEGVFRKEKEDEVSKYQKTSGQSY